MLAPPAGPAYNFIVNLSVSRHATKYATDSFRYTYPGAWINAFVAAGLIYLHYNRREHWTSPWHTYLPIALLYLLANVFLAIVPFIPPKTIDPDGYPYYVFPVVGVGVLILGGIYWTFWKKVFPYFGGYRIVGERTILEDGAEVVRYRRIPKNAGAK